jgi:hypothetical protein
MVLVDLVIILTTSKRRRRMTAARTVVRGEEVGELRGDVRRINHGRNKRVGIRNIINIRRVDRREGIILELVRMRMEIMIPTLWSCVIFYHQPHHLSKKLVWMENIITPTRVHQR